MAYDRFIKKAVRADLLDKLRNGNLDRKEATELKSILEHDKEVAVRAGDVALLLGITLALGLIINSLTEKKPLLESIWEFIYPKKKKKVAA